VGGFFDHPAVQGGVAPFVVALAAAMLLRRFNLAGLAAIAGLATAAYFLNGPVFEPLTITRKMILVWIAGAAAGFLADALVRPGRGIVASFAVAGAVASVWTFWTVLAQKPAMEAVLAGGGVALLVAAMIAAVGALQGEPVRAGGAALGLGLGAGVAAILGASAVYGLYGIALGAGAGAYLLVQMVSGRAAPAGALFALPAALAAALLGAGAVLLAQLAWYAAALLLLIPAAAFLPLPKRQPLWLQAIVVSLYTLAAAAVPWVLAWQYGGRPNG
jgi:hypothetical protein